MQNEEDGAPAKVEIVSGIRATGSLTIGNYVGAVKQFIELQDAGHHPLIFVADLHVLTDREPDVAIKYRKEVVSDYLGLGMDPDRCDIFIQSQIAPQVFTLMSYLLRLISVSELLRVPTLKDKLKSNQRSETANALLAAYPVLMAADILLQRARVVPVGEDQIPHMEVTRLLARRFNDRYGKVFPIPQPAQLKPVRILGLRGSGKMSKSIPEEAIFLTDDAAAAVRKVTKAKTAIAGEMNEALESNFSLAFGLGPDATVVQDIEGFRQLHMSGENVMGDFKKLLGSLVGEFLSDFQRRRALVTKDPSYIRDILASGLKIARENGTETLNLVNEALWRE
jgi:tryptophanyl-tRNA synthetase